MRVFWTLLMLNKSLWGCWFLPIYLALTSASEGYESFVYVDDGITAKEELDMDHIITISILCMWICIMRVLICLLCLVFLPPATTDVWPVAVGVIVVGPYYILLLTIFDCAYCHVKYLLFPAALVCLNQKFQLNHIKYLYCM